jgi:uncharacterized membrane protein (DUF373 family)
MGLRTAGAATIDSLYNLDMLLKLEDGMRTWFSQNLSVLEAILYIGVGVLLAAAAVSTVFEAGAALWRGITTHTLSDSVLVLLDQLLLVLMLVEILHTVRISLQSQSLMMEPFLIVGLIATVRRVLVITMEAASKIKETGEATPESATVFRNSMIELGVLGTLILVFVISIYFLRRVSGREESQNLLSPE